jgi:hypothetical protein
VPSRVGDDNPMIDSAAGLSGRPSGIGSDERSAGGRGPPAPSG